MPTDTEIAKKAAEGYLGPAINNVANTTAEVKRQRRRVTTYVKASADSMASDTTAAQAFFRAPGAIRLVSAHYTCHSTGITAHATNYATLIVEKNDGAGGAATTCASFASDTVTTDDVTALVPKALTLATTQSDYELASGNVLRFKITKAASGVVVPAGIVEVVYEEI